MVKEYVFYLIATEKYKCCEIEEENFCFHTKEGKRRFFTKTELEEEANEDMEFINFRFKRKRNGK